MSNLPKPDHLKYRPDIDGLRAIAILAVLAFHAFPTDAPGGYVGVDIFFVISGFLISTIIFRQLENDKFTYRHFYSRRIRRIFPALILMMIAVWMVGRHVLLFDEFRQLGKHIAGGNGFISNIVLWNEAGYFDNSSETKPLLHLWSLGIEEQFYFLWPITLVLVRKRSQLFLVVTLLVALVSFGLGINALYRHTSAAAFYLPWNRFWELMIGGFLAYASLYRREWLVRLQDRPNLKAGVGMVLILAAVWLLDRDSEFPGWWALLPALGSFLLILSRDSWINRNILSNRVLVYIGLISYPLYLWHWPVISFQHILGFTSDGQLALGAGFSIVLASLTFELVEKNIRKSNSGRLIVGLAAISFLFIGLGYATYLGKFVPRNNTPGVGLALAAAGDWEHPQGFSVTTIAGEKVHIKHGAKQKVLFLGDSHMEQYSPRIVQLIGDDPLNTKTAVFATRGGCPPIPNVFEDKHERCTSEFRRAMIDYALSPEIDSVVLGASWSYLLQTEKPAVGVYRYHYLRDGEKIFFDEGGIDLAFQSLEKLLADIAGKKKVFLVIDNPNGGNFNPKTFFTGNRLAGFEDKEVRFRPYSPKQAGLRRRMIAMAERAGAEVIDSAGFLCNEEGQCRVALDDGTPLYKDSGHLRPFFVREYLDIFDVTVRK